MSQQFKPSSAFWGVLACASYAVPSALAGGQPYLLKDIRPDAERSIPFQLTVVGTLVFFTAIDGVTGFELWVTDGTAQGTHLVKDIIPGSGTASYPRALTAVGSRLFFQVDDGVNGTELWVSDGTSPGTYLVKDINPTGDSEPSDRLGNGEPMTAWNGRAIFAAEDGVHGRELWVSDGTLAGTFIVRDIRPGSPDGDPWFLTDVGAFFLFSANATGVGRELWRSDGTTATTVLLRDIWPGGNGFPYLLVNVNGTVFFKADDAPSNDELWKSDGTVSGTVKVKEIHPTTGSEPFFLTNVDGTLFFPPTTPTTTSNFGKAMEQSRVPFESPTLIPTGGHSRNLRSVEFSTADFSLKQTTACTAWKSGSPMVRRQVPT